MARINDLGGTEGFGPVPTGDDDPEPFHADWEARVFALSRVLGRRGVFNPDEFRDAIERMPPQDYLHASYYERWLAGMETLLREKGVLPDA
jgi:hypothetical protein